MGGSGEQSLTGPDFAQGIAVDALAPGAKLLGHAHGEAVLLARSKGESGEGADVFAIGGTCTHYGGPLVDGLVVGDTVRCPWHHACFSMRTGEAVRAPALNPVACFDVEKRGDKLYVLGKRAAASAPVRDASSVHPESVVIVGAGAAGNAAAEMLRRRGYSGPVTLVGADASVPYDRPNLSKDYLAGTAPEEWIPLRPMEFYAEQRIELRLGARVTKVDVSARTVTLSDGATLHYGALLLATGAEPVRLQIPGADLPHVHCLRTLDDSRAIIARATSTGVARVVVIGASFIGLEAAAAMRTRGLEVHVVAPDQRPLERVMGPDVGDFVKRIHEEHGVVFHLGQTATAIDTKSITLASGETIAADLVVVGIGVRPNLALAESAGLAIDRGVVVDALLATSVAGIWAAGDIARWPDPHSGQNIRVEHWVVAQRHGQIAARNILGENVPCDIVPFFWSQHYDVAISYVGHAERWDRIDVSGTLGERDATVAFRSGDATLAVVTVGRDGVSLAAERAFEERDRTALANIGR